MASRQPGVHQCEHDRCTRSCTNSRWSHIRAAEQGWYFQRDGCVWCPEHRPPYAPATWKKLAACDGCGNRTRVSGPYQDSANEELWLCSECLEPYDLD